MAKALTEAQHGHAGALSKEIAAKLVELTELLSSNLPVSNELTRRARTMGNAVDSMLESFDDAWFVDARKAGRAGEAFKGESPYILPKPAEEKQAVKK